MAAAENCYGCGTPLIPKDKVRWRGAPYLKGLCPRCCTMVEGGKRHGGEMKRCKGHPSKPDRIEERRDALEKHARKKVRGAVKGKGNAKDKKPKREPPKDPTAVETEGGGPTVVATCILCNMCGEPNAIPKSKTATALTMRCAKCESVIRVTGGKLVKLRVPRKAMRVAEQMALVPSAEEPRKGERDHAGSKAAEYTRINVKVRLDQHKIIRQAMEVARRMNSDEAKEWAGRSLELICGDFLAGAPTAIVKQVLKEGLGDD